MAFILIINSTWTSAEICSMPSSVDLLCAVIRLALLYDAVHSSPIPRTPSVFLLHIVFYTIELFHILDILE